MGRTDALIDYSEYFDQIINRYAHTIAGQFFGHTHRDQFELAYSNYSDQTAANAVSLTYIMCSMTPTSGNPSFRVYDVDPDTYGILDYTMYITNLTAPGYQTSGPVWEKYYSAKETYGSLLSPPYTDSDAELTPAFWHNVTTLFEQDDSVFQAYYDRKQRGWEYEYCDASCKASEICQLRSAQSQYGCVNSNVSSVTTKRDLGRGMPTDGHGHGHSSECEGSLIVPIMRNMLDGNGEDFGRIMRKKVNELSQIRRHY